MSISIRYWAIFAATCLLFVAVGSQSRAQDPSPAPASQSPVAKPEAPPAATETPAQIELLETKIRFEANGDCRKEVHTRVRINSELGARQFAHLNFNFNRAFEKVEIPLVHITHESGGSADILPSAITDEPDPAVADAPLYQDVRVKSVRILGLEPSDVLEYRVVTTTEHGSPKDSSGSFWLDHSFDRTGVVSREVFSLDLPASSFIKDQALEAALPTPTNPASLRSPTDVGQIYISPETHESSRKVEGSGKDARLLYHWDVKPADLPGHKAPSDESDVVITTFSSWDQLQHGMQLSLQVHSSTLFYAKTLPAIQKASPEPASPEAATYNLVSTKVRTADIPLDLSRFGKREADAILSSGVGTPEDKIYLLVALLSNVKRTRMLLVSSSDAPERQLPRPTLFTQILLEIDDGKRVIYLDPSLEVAPYGMIRPDLRGKKALDLSASCSGASCWKTISGELPFSSTQRVSVDATITPEGALNAKVKYSMRGDNELLLRLAFHQSPRDKWKEVAQLMSLSDGFRGKIISVSASDPLATKLPFTVEYEVSQPKFVDWSKKQVRIPAPLPVLSVPDLPGKVAESNKVSTIDLGTPLDVETRVTLHLPPHTGVELPTGTIVDRDYATFVSRYNTDSGVVTAIRHINFIHRQVGADRVPDYAAFLHAVQTDQAQLFTLTRADGLSTTAASTPQKP
jgi:Domain of Unknown Function with PDB structure (DUF3857)